jgi:peptidyl-prolyl cis-trans isomerase SurA
LEARPAFNREADASEPAADIAMRNVLAHASICRRAAAAFGGVLIALVASVAAAQSVYVVVNGDPITYLDIEHRTRFLTLANQGKAPARQQVINELIEEKLKLQLTKRFDFSSLNLDGEVESTINGMARRSGAKNQEQFAQNLAGRGVPISTLKSRVRAQIVWSQVVRAKFAASLQLNDSEVLKELELRNKEDSTGYDYTLRPIVFVVPRGSPAATLDARRREAEALRTRFQSCEEGIAAVRAMPGVVVRAQVVRSSADLPAQLRSILEKTELGRLTPAEQTPDGIALYAVCAKKESAKDNSPVKREMRDEIYSKQFEASSKKFLKELRDQAYIQYK